jgi:hypothetical protein
VLFSASTHFTAFAAFSPLQAPKGPLEPPESAKLDAKSISLPGKQGRASIVPVAFTLITAASPFGGQLAKTRRMSIGGGTMPSGFDHDVIGSGFGGKVAALRARELRMYWPKANSPSILNLTSNFPATAFISIFSHFPLASRCFFTTLLTNTSRQTEAQNCRKRTDFLNFLVSAATSSLVGSACA